MTVRLLSLTVVLMSAATARAQTSYPMLMGLHPVAVQAGQSSEVEVAARYSMHGAFRVLAAGEGVTGEVVTPMELKPGQKPPNLQKINLRFDVAAEALPGIRDVRIATPQGVSTLGQLVVTPLPVFTETAPKNDTLAQAEAVTVPAAVCGRIERAEDVDFFKFTVASGAKLTFHVRCMRLQDRIHDLQQHADPIISLRNSAGTTVATVDNHFAADPLFGYEFTHGGEYTLEVRDVRYKGNQYWGYCVEISDQPYVQTVHPLGVPAGQKTTVDPVGVHIPDGETTELAAVETGIRELPLTLGKRPVNPVPVVVSELPQILEVPGENGTLETAQRVLVPGLVSGRAESAADVDCYQFTAKKGERYSFEVLARRCQSALDANLRVLDAKGRVLVENDDQKQFRRTLPDSLIEFWAAPADGEYVVEIRDLHLRGGAEFTYALRITRSEPTFDLFLDTDKTQLAPGTNGVLFVHAIRKNGFAGEIQLAIAGLPDGVTADCGRILADGNDGCIVLQAEADAELAAANVTVTGSGTVGDTKLIQSAIVYQETYQPGGGRGHWPVEVHTVGIGAPSDIRGVELSTYELTLKPGESKRIDVTVQRAPEFKQNVQLDLLFRHLSSTYADTLPPGVKIDTKNSQTLLTGGASQGHITLTCDPKATPVERQQVAVMANVSLNFVMKATYSSRPLLVTVAP